jgi:hypothetical protein
LDISIATWYKIKSLMVCQTLKVWEIFKVFYIATRMAACQIMQIRLAKGHPTKKGRQRYTLKGHNF